MAITCTCPKCGRFCGFKNAYAGRRARCLNCATPFIIPQREGETAQFAETPSLEPLPGFYHKVFRGTASAFMQKESLFGIILCVTLTAFHFVVGNEDYSFTMGRMRPPLVVGWIATFICGGYLLWYFMETINVTIMDNDILPEIFVGGGFVFLGESFKSIYMFIASFALAVIPGAAVTAILRKNGIVIDWLNILIILLSLSTLPMILGILGSGLPPWKIFRYDQIIRVMIGAWRPYLLTVGITFVALASVFLTVGYFSTDPGMTRLQAALIFAGRLVSVFLMIGAMRTIGLFSRHYYPCFPFLSKTFQQRSEF